MAMSMRRQGNRPAFEAEWSHCVYTCIKILLLTQSFPADNECLNFMPKTLTLSLQGKNTAYILSAVEVKHYTLLEIKAA